MSDIAPKESALIAFLAHFLWSSSKQVAGTSDLTHGCCAWRLIWDYIRNWRFRPWLLGEEFGYFFLKLCLLAFLVLIFLVWSVLILALVSSTSDFIPVRFHGFINPFVKILLSNIQLVMIVIGAFFGESLGLAVILCADLGRLPEIRDMQWWQLAGNVL